MKYLHFLAVGAILVLSACEMDDVPEICDNQETDIPEIVEDAISFEGKNFEVVSYTDSLGYWDEPYFFVADPDLLKGSCNHFAMIVGFSTDEWRWNFGNELYSENSGNVGILTDEYGPGPPVLGKSEGGECGMSFSESEFHFRYNASWMYDEEASKLTIHIYSIRDMLSSRDMSVYLPGRSIDYHVESLENGNILLSSEKEFIEIQCVE